MLLEKAVIAAAVLLMEGRARLWVSLGLAVGGFIAMAAARPYHGDAEDRTELMARLSLIKPQLSLALLLIFEHLRVQLSLLGSGLSRAAASASSGGWVVAFLRSAAVYTMRCAIPCRTAKPAPCAEARSGFCLGSFHLLEHGAGIQREAHTAHATIR